MFASIEDARIRITETVNDLKSAISLHLQNNSYFAATKKFIDQISETVKPIFAKISDFFNSPHDSLDIKTFAMFSSVILITIILLVVLKRFKKQKQEQPI